MPDTHRIGTVVDAAGQLVNPHLGHGAARDVSELTLKILSDPNLGPAYLDRVLEERGVSLGSMGADDIQAALRAVVAPQPILAAYVEQLYKLAAESPAVKANPDLLLPEHSLQRLAMSTPSAEITQPKNPENIVGKVREAGL